MRSTIGLHEKRENTIICRLLWAFVCLQLFILAPGVDVPAATGHTYYDSYSAYYVRRTVDGSNWTLYSGAKVGQYDVTWPDPNYFYKSYLWFGPDSELAVATITDVVLKLKYTLTTPSSTDLYLRVAFNNYTESGWNSASSENKYWHSDPDYNGNANRVAQVQITGSSSSSWHEITLSTSRMASYLRGEGLTNHRFGLVLSVTDGTTPDTAMSDIFNISGTDDTWYLTISDAELWVYYDSVEIPTRCKAGSGHFTVDGYNRDWDTYYYFMKNDTSTFEFVPDSGYEFDYWRFSDDSTHHTNNPADILTDHENEIWVYFRSLVPIIGRSPSWLDPSCTQGQDAASQSFEVWNSGGGTLNYTISDDASWLSESPTSGNSTGEHDTITVNYDTSGLSVGTYYATITISDPSANNSPQHMSVTLTVNSLPSIGRSPSSLTPSCVQGQNAASQSFEVWNSGSGTLNYTISDNASWLSESPTSGNSTGEHDTITVNYNTSGLSADTYNATITISDPNASNTPQTIAVTLTVNPPSVPSIGRSPSSLTPSCTQGQNAASQTFEVWNSGSGTLNYTITNNASWLSESPSSGNSTGEHDTITVNYNTSGLSAGPYNATITISDPNASNSPQTIAVTLTVSPTSVPSIGRSPSSLTPSCVQGQNAASQSFEVWNSGSGTLNYTISDNASWLSEAPSSGNSTGEHDTITVNYNTSGLSAGTYNATITISDPNASNSPQTIAVTLTVSRGGSPLDEAVDNTNLSFITYGQANWFGQSSIYYYGGDAAQSGNIDDYGRSWMQTTVTGPGTLRFYWKVSSEEGHDTLGVYIDGKGQEYISGEVNWTPKEYSIGSGQHTIGWEYAKDPFLSYGCDCGWVDKVEWTGSQPPVIFVRTRDDDANGGAGQNFPVPDGYEQKGSIHVGNGTPSHMATDYYGNSINNGWIALCYLKGLDPPVKFVISYDNAIGPYPYGKPAGYEEHGSILIADGRPSLKATDYDEHHLNNGWIAVYYKIGLSSPPVVLTISRDDGPPGVNYPYGKPAGRFESGAIHIGDGSQVEHATDYWGHHVKNGWMAMFYLNDYRQSSGEGIFNLVSFDGLAALKGIRVPLAESESAQAVFEVYEMAADATTGTLIANSFAVPVAKGAAECASPAMFVWLEPDVVYAIGMRWDGELKVAPGVSVGGQRTFNGLTTIGGATMDEKAEDAEGLIESLDTEARWPIVLDYAK